MNPNSFQVGDTVVHWSYGPGVIVCIDEKSLAGQRKMYYEVQVRDLVLYVPVEEAERRRLRPPTANEEYANLFTILRGPCQQLPDDRFERKAYLAELLRDGSLESVCRAIRDLSAYAYRKKLNDYDTATLERARRFLLDEWNISLSVPINDAQRQLDHLLEHSRPEKAI
jgi:RNA polymerase-interacting CarD/CdnL/TRCF family regulator